VTGGTDGRVVGGSPVALASAEVVDPNLLASSRTVPIAATMTAARRRHTATLLDDGTVLIVGGLDGMGLPLASLETFNPTTLTFGAVPLSLPFGLSDHTATRLADNTVLIAGGRRADGSSSSAAFLFTRTGPTLATLTATLTTPRQMHTATLAANGDVLLAGGVTTGGVATAACELYVPAPAGTTASASFVAGPGDLGVARFEHAAVRLDDGTILVAGGRGGALGTTASPTADVRRFDAGVTTVTAVVSMLTARADFVAISEPGGRAVFAGGAIAATPGGGSDRAAPITAVAEVMTPGAATTTATFDPVIAAPRRGMATATLGDGTTVIIGGRREAGIVVPGGDQFSP
jgi:hypothetical protein